MFIKDVIDIIGIIKIQFGLRKEMLSIDQRECGPEIFSANNLLDR